MMTLAQRSHSATLARSTWQARSVSLYHTQMVTYCHLLLQTKYKLHTMLAPFKPNFLLLSFLHRYVSDQAAVIHVYPGEGVAGFTATIQLERVPAVLADWRTVEGRHGGVMWNLQWKYTR